jgi:hypothetical protein
MAKRVIYTVTIPELVMISQNEPPVPTHRSVTYPLVDCPMINRGDKSPVNVCGECSNCIDIKERYVECSYQQSNQEKDEMERRRKGITQTVNNPANSPQPKVESKDPGAPKNVFTKK